jgi:hypothetical protein
METPVSNQDAHLEQGDLAAAQRPVLDHHAAAEDLQIPGKWCGGSGSTGSQPELRTKEYAASLKSSKAHLHLEVLVIPHMVELEHLIEHLHEPEPTMASIRGGEQSPAYLLAGARVAGLPGWSRLLFEMNEGSQQSGEGSQRSGRAHGSAPTVTNSGSPDQTAPEALTLVGLAPEHTLAHGEDHIGGLLAC